MENDREGNTREARAAPLFGEAMLRVSKKGSTQTNSSLVEGEGGEEEGARLSFRDAVCVVWTGPGAACGVMTEILHSLKTSPLTFSSAGP